MSYDLFFQLREGAAAPDVKALAAYFKERKNYQVSKEQALYQNEITGVYFIFDLGASEDSELANAAPVNFVLNYFRPHIFGLEAEPEVRALVEHFGFLVSDPQVGGMGDGEYSTEGFLSGWNQGNEFGYHSIMSQHPDQNIPTLPTAQIESCWRWNLEHDALQEELGEDIFVPRLMFIQWQGRVVSTVVWPDAIPSAMPQADMVLIPRKTILPKKFLRHPEDLVIASWAEVMPILEVFPLRTGTLPYRCMEYSIPPESVVSFLRALQPTAEKVEAIPADKVLNAELVAKVRAK
jgi:hypothetical protein